MITPNLILKNFELALLHRSSFRASRVVEDFRRFRPLQPCYKTAAASRVVSSRRSSLDERSVDEGFGTLPLFPMLGVVEPSGLVDCPATTVTVIPVFVPPAAVPNAPAVCALDSPDVEARVPPIDEVAAAPLAPPEFAFNAPPSAPPAAATMPPEVVPTLPPESSPIVPPTVVVAVPPVAAGAPPVVAAFPPPELEPSAPPETIETAPAAYRRALSSRCRRAVAASAASVGLLGTMGAVVVPCPAGSRY